MKTTIEGNKIKVHYCIDTQIIKILVYQEIFVSSKKSSRFAFPLSLRTILIFPYVIFLIFTITTAVFISSMYGHNAVNNVAHQLQNETTSRVQQYLESFLSLPHKINELNAYAIENGNLIPDDASSMQQYFLQQVKLQPQVTSIYFGNSEGGLIGAGREGSEGVFYFTETKGLKNGDFQKFGLEENGAIIPLPLAIVPNFDARTRPWFISASQQKKGNLEQYLHIVHRAGHGDRRKPSSLQRHERTDRCGICRYFPFATEQIS